MNISNDKLFAPTSKMANMLGLSKDFLDKNRDRLFKQNKHYFKPRGLNKIMWCIEEMVKWVKGEDSTNNPFIDTLNQIKF
jgi:hypothetical protein